jgi:F-type H+-transporting ATPase subunit epsilon
MNERETKSLIIETKTGELNILPGHLDMMSILGDGLMKIDNEEALIIYGGVIEVIKDKVTVLVDKVKSSSKVNIVENQKEIDKLEKRLREEDLSDIDFKQIIKEKNKLETEMRIARAGK